MEVTRMSLNLEQKKAVVAEVSGVFAGAKAAVVAEYRGLTVAQMTDLRVRARKSEVYLKVVKNSLVRHAIKDSSFQCLSDHLVGPLVLAIAKDPVAVAKVVNGFAKDNERFLIKAGTMGGKLLSKAEMQALATLPGREQLLAMLLGAMKAPTQ